MGDEGLDIDPGAIENSDSGKSDPQTASLSVSELAAMLANLSDEDREKLAIELDRDATDGPQMSRDLAE